MPLSRGTNRAPGDADHSRELRFLAHEYFHHYNIKRIRPFVLGHFDYDKAAPTPMLWVSEGFTVYYESKYLGYAGLELEPPGELPDSWLGAIAEDVDRKLIISALESGSPAQRAGLAACDEIKTLDGTPVDAKTLAQILAVRKPGDTITLRVASGAGDRELSVTLDHKLNRSFRMSRIANLDALQSAILASWEKN